MSEIKLFVWQGGKVLEGWKSGVVVVAATSEDEAWEKLKTTDFGAYAQLKYGVAGFYYDTQEELDRLLAEPDDEEIQEDYKAAPVAYAPSDFPPLIMWGAS